VSQNSMMADDLASEREEYLRRVLDAFEHGHIEPYEYTRCVLAVNAAASVEEMAAMAAQAWGQAGDAPVAPRRALDPVDLALLRSPPGRQAHSSGHRYVALVLVFVMFVVLIAVGMWLTVHVHTVGASSAGTVTGALGLGAARVPGPG